MFDYFSQKANCSVGSHTCLHLFYTNIYSFCGNIYILKDKTKNVKHLKYESQYKKLIVRISLPLDIHLYGLKKNK